jgi:lysyl-tRNA synthetase class 2
MALNKIRDFYLQHIWSRYPAPLPGGICGRLVQKLTSTQSKVITNQSEVITTQRDEISVQEMRLFFEFTNEEGKKIIRELNLNSLVWLENKTDTLPIEVLAVGDWVQLWCEEFSTDKLNIATAKNDVSEINMLSELNAVPVIKTVSEMNGVSELNLIAENKLFKTKIVENIGLGELPQNTNLVFKKILLLAPCLGQEILETSDQELFRSWIQFLNQVRQYFINQKFDEIKTPTLVVCPGTEPFLEPFVTEYKFGQTTQEYFLPTSPELSLKKCLARGWHKIFEIRPCFRNGEKSAWHSTEFYMLEWYRSFENLEAIKIDICMLLDDLEFPGWKKSKLVSLSMADLFKKYLQFELKPNTRASELLSLAAKLNLQAGSDWDFDDIFYLLYIEKIEPRLGEFEFLILEKYPPSQAALARLTSEGWGERFEFYINGVEIANAFHELNDPQIQRLRFEEDLAKKKKYGKRNIPLDENFLLHLEQGMPPAAGIALGLERLFMICAKIRDIQQITPY